jgi:hypothetical protein
VKKARGMPTAGSVWTRNPLKRRVTAAAVHENDNTQRCHPEKRGISSEHHDCAPGDEIPRWRSE